ncbi:MAG: hypothetical protein ACE141_14930 [Bryobacteraceae bacterium]
MNILWSFTLVVGVVLQVLVIAALLQGSYRRFRVLFVYMVVLLLTTVAEAAAFYNANLFYRASRYYWTIDAGRQVLIFLLVLSLIYGALEVNPKRSSIRRLLAICALAFVLVSLLLTHDPRVGHWMNNLSRNLGFLAVVLNLVLWAVLIKFGRADRTLLMLSGGMGVQMAGKAIGHSLRQLSKTTELAGNLIIVVSHLLCLYIWWQAFRRDSPGHPFELQRQGP